MMASTRVAAWMRHAVAAGALLAAACAPAAAPTAGTAPAPAAGAPAAGQPAAPAAAPAATAPPSAEWDRVLEEARKEGEVIIWGENGPAAREFTKDAFEKAYPGIRVNLFQAPLASDRDTRYLQELQAGIARLDVMISGSAGVNARVKPVGGLQSVRPYLREDILSPQNWREGKLIWVDKEQQYMIMSDTLVYPPVTVNSSVQPGDVQSWTDLLDPRWNGKIVMMDPRGSGPGFAAGVYMYNAPDLGPSFTERFYQNGIVFSPDQRQNVEWTDSGRTLLNVYARTKEVEDLNSVGGKVRPISSLTANGRLTAAFNGSSGILFIPNVNPLPHPNAAKVYASWFYSREGQQAMVDILAIPSNRADVDLSKLPPYTIPQAGVDYINLNDEAYTGTERVQAMRDDVNKWYKSPQ